MNWKHCARATIAASVAISMAHGADTSPEAGWAAVQKCAQSESERARHTCLDQVLRDAGLLTAEMRAQQERRNFGLEARPAVPAPKPAPAPKVAVVPAPAATPQAAVPAPAPAPVAPGPAASAAPDRLEIRIASVATGRDGRMLLTSDEGAVWRQMESVDLRIPPAAGDQLRVRKSNMGGYLCTLAKSNVTYRCERSR